MQRRSVEVTVKDEEVDFKFKVEDHEQDVKAEVKDEAEVDFKFKVEDHEQKQQGAKAEVKDEEADFKSKVEEHEQNEQDVKSPGGEKKGLNPDAKRVTLPQLPPYVIPGSIPRELLSTCVTRPALTWGFGAAVQFSQIRLTFLDGTPDIDALALHTKHNPELPRAPGRHGIYLSACPRAADEVPTPIFVCDGMHQWGYRGHFVKSPSAPMLAPVWRLQSKRVIVPRNVWCTNLNLNWVSVQENLVERSLRGRAGSLLLVSCCDLSQTQQDSCKSDLPGCALEARGSCTRYTPSAQEVWCHHSSRTPVATGPRNWHHV